MPRVAVLVVAMAMVGMVVAALYYTAIMQSRRMLWHVAPLGISYLVLCLVSLEGFWSGYRVLARWDGVLLCSSYGLGALGLLCLIATANYRQGGAGA